MSEDRTLLEELVRAYGSACANHQHDRNKPGGSTDRRQIRWEMVEAEIKRLTEGAIEGWAQHQADGWFFQAHRKPDSKHRCARLILSPPTQTPGEKT